MQYVLRAIACAAALAACGCGALKTRSADYQIVMGPTEGNTVAGTIAASAVPGGVRFHGHLRGLVPGGTHGFHVHERGDCSAPDAQTAGEHFNPTVSEHGDPSGLIHHAGDLPNLVADPRGEVDFDVVLHGVALGTGTIDDVRGRALIVHRDPDDYTTQPAGNSGPRVACGVIVKAP